MAPDPVPNDLISLRQAAEVTINPATGKPITLQTLRVWIRQGRIMGWKCGKIYLVSRAEVAGAMKVEPVRITPSRHTTVRQAILAGEAAKRELKRRGAM
jgi:hypothetical protein